MDSQQLQTWNEQHPVGTPVLAWPGARDEAPKHSYITHPAGAGLPGPPMVYVKGYGNIALTHVERATGEAAAHERQYREELVRRHVRWSVPANEIEAAQKKAREAVLAELDFFQDLSAADFEGKFATLISAALERHLLDWLGKERDMRGYFLGARQLLSLPRPAALDHRQRFETVLGQESLDALRAELPKWLHGSPAKQPYKPEIVHVEPAQGCDGFRVTLALGSIGEAFGLGRNLGLPAKKGGLADG